MRPRMTRAEYDVVLATEPATGRQVGAVHVEYQRLGYGDGDRAAKLGLSAALLGLDELGTHKDLVMGEAGRLVGMLRGFGDRGELDALLPAEPEPEPRHTWADLRVVIAEAFSPRRFGDFPGPGG